MFLNGCEADALVVGLGFDDANSLLVCEQNVIGRANIRLVLAHSNAEACVEIKCILVLNMPTGRPQAFIDLVPSSLLGSLVVSCTICC